MFLVQLDLFNDKKSYSLCKDQQLCESVYAKNCEGGFPSSRRREIHPNVRVRPVSFSHQPSTFVIARNFLLSPVLFVLPFKKIS